MVCRPVYKGGGSLAELLIRTVEERIVSGTVPDKRGVPATVVRWRSALAAHAMQPELSLLRPVSPASLEETCCASSLGGRGRIPCVL